MSVLFYIIVSICDRVQRVPYDETFRNARCVHMRCGNLRSKKTVSKHLGGSNNNNNKNNIAAGRGESRRVNPAITMKNVTARREGGLQLSVEGKKYDMGSKYLCVVRIVLGIWTIVLN